MTREPIDEARYLADIKERQTSRWPELMARQPHYPFGEVSLPEYLGRWAAQDPDKALFNYYGSLVTFAQLDDLSTRFACRLVAHGVVPGDKVAVFMGSCPQFAIAFLGVLKAGAVHVPVNPMFKEHELLYELNDSQAVVLVADHALMPFVRKVQSQTSLREVYGTSLAQIMPAKPAFHAPAALTDSARHSDAPGFLETLAELTSTDVADPKRDGDLDAIAALNYTGGTTGMPKGCVHTQRDMIYTAATACQINCPMDQNDICVNFHPLFWIAGEDLGLIFPIFTGASCILLARWDPLSFLQATHRFRPNRTNYLVDNVVELMEHPRLIEFDLSCIESSGVSSFVKKLNHDYRDQWHSITGSTMVELSYGMTETHTCDTVTAGLQQDNFDLSLQPILVGLPVAGTEFKIYDFASGELVPLDAEGEICVRSPSNLKGYWNKSDAITQALRNGWLHTGDIGAIDQMGLLHFFGRRKEMLKVKGMSEFPAEIEAILGRHPAIIGSGVIGREDPERGQVPVAFVRLDSQRGAGVSAEQIQAWCIDAMATYKLPEIRVVDTLPMTATGKVKKGKLEKLL